MSSGGKIPKSEGELENWTEWRTLCLLQNTVVNLFWGAYMRIPTDKQDGPVFLHVDLFPPNLKNHTKFSALPYRECMISWKGFRKKAAKLNGELGCEASERKIHIKQAQSIMRTG